MSVRPAIPTWLASSWASLLLHGATLVAVFYGYMRLMEAFGGFSTELLQRQLIELGLVLYLYTVLRVAMKPGRGRSALAALPLLLIYLVHDLFYLVFGKVFRLVNIAEFPELVQILPVGYSTLLLAVLCVPLVLFLLRVDYRQPRRLALWLAPLLLVTVAVKAAPEGFTRSFEQFAGEIVRYSDGKNVEQNGRLAMLAYREAQRSIAVAELGPHRDRERYEQQAAVLTAELSPHGNRRNVHLIVLESFLDPRLFRDLRFSSPPAHPAFDRLFGDQLGLSRSPVFGGSTAQAEFEVLCGVPAFERFSSVEFNVFSGAAAHCLPGMLKDLGYRSVATNSYKPNFFNALPAYQGAGFADSYFPEAFSGARRTYLKLDDPGDEWYAFDRPLLEQNLQFVRSHQQEHPGQPLFNYVLTIYGHTPHLLDPAQRPERIALASHYPDDHLQRAVNQFYYRTEAIAAYLKHLLEIDRDSLIILVSDHVPPLRNGPNTYGALRYLDNRENNYYYNRIAILENGEATVYSEMRHYELPPLILDYVSDGAYCRKHACAFQNGAQRASREAYMERYLRLMAHAAQE
jgi:phosphoglycerol transferase MdoB-like AlkP superfamily enzyme